MNAQMMAQLLGMNQQNTQKLSKAWNQAQHASQGVNSLGDAQKVIKAFGMTNTAIEQAGKLLDSPLAGVVASACGADINKARKALHQLTGTSIPMNKAISSMDDLSRLKAGLQQLKS